MCVPSPSRAEVVEKGLTGWGRKGVCKLGIVWAERAGAGKEIPGAAQPGPSPCRSPKRLVLRVPPIGGHSPRGSGSQCTPRDAGLGRQESWPLCLVGSGCTGPRPGACHRGHRGGGWCLGHSALGVSAAETPHLSPRGLSMRSCRFCEVLLQVWTETSAAPGGPSAGVGQLGAGPVSPQCGSSSWWSAGRLA